MDKATHSHLIKGYIITICGGLGWALGGACGQILFRDCGVDADWLVPIRMFLAGLMVLAIATLFSAVGQMDGIAVNTIFTKEDIHGYASYDRTTCPFCQKNVPVEAIVNSFGYSKL